MISSYALPHVHIQPATITLIVLWKVELVNWVCHYWLCTLLLFRRSPATPPSSFQHCLCFRGFSKNTRFLLIMMMLLYRWMFLTNLHSILERRRRHNNTFIPHLIVKDRFTFKPDTKIFMELFYFNRMTTHTVRVTWSTLKANHQYNLIINTLSP